MKQQNDSKMQVLLNSNELQELFDMLTQKSYTIIGSTVRDQAVVYAEIKSCNNLPAERTHPYRNRRKKFWVRNNTLSCK